nr:site-specific DNA-methyltransferase [Arthrobacter sp. ATA002]
MSGGTPSCRPRAGKTGYPTQKPEGLLRRTVAASSREGDWVLDFFAGSGTLGAVAAKLNRRFVCVDANPQAIEVMSRRLGHAAELVPAEAVAAAAAADAGTAAVAADAAG